MRLTHLFLAALILAGSPCWSQDKPGSAAKPKKKSKTQKPDERFATPKNAYLTWRKALDAEMMSDEWNVLQECYNDNPAWPDRGEMLDALTETIKAKKLEFGDVKPSGERADVILKNDAGETLTIGFVKEGDAWRIKSIPDLRPWYKKLLNPVLLLPVFGLILLFALWRRHAILKAIERAESEE